MIASRCMNTKGKRPGPNAMFPDRLTRGERSRIKRARKTLLAWFELHGRDFPWRRPEATNYERVCVEVLLQRTRAETVAGLYGFFFEKYPSWNSLASAPVEELEDVLKPFGLWRRRARSVSALAKYGPVAFSCRPKCSFRPLSVRKRPGFSSPELSAFFADCRSR